MQANAHWGFVIPAVDLSPGAVIRDKAFLSITVLAKRAPVPGELLRRAVTSHGMMQVGKFCLDGDGNLCCSASIFAETATAERFKAALERVAAMVRWAQSGGPKLAGVAP